MTYTLRTYRQLSPRKWRLIEIRRDLNSAQLGGLIAHAMDDTDKFYVDDEEHGTIMEYRRKGI